MRVKLAVLVLVCLVAVPVAAEDLTVEKRAAIRELMEVTGAADMGAMLADAFVGQMREALQASNPELPPRAYEVMEEEVRAVLQEGLAKKDGLLEQVVPVYHRYLSLEDTRQLLAFYRTPVGRKAIRVMPQLTRESMQVGQAWGQTLVPILQERLTRRFEAEGLQ